MIFIFLLSNLRDGLNDCSTSQKSYSTYPQQLSTSIFLVSQGCEQIGVVIADLRVATLEFSNLPTSMQHGRMIALAERLADLGQAEGRQFLGQGHRQLPRSG